MNNKTWEQTENSTYEKIKKLKHIIKKTKLELQE